MRKVIHVKVIPNSLRSSVKKVGSTFRVKLDAPARNFKANERLLEVLADYFGTKKSRIKILRGWKSRNKIIEILD